MEDHKSQVTNEQQPTRSGRPQRLTGAQIQEMEDMFKVCPHPKNKERQELSAKLGLPPIKVLHWFQNRRSHMKVLKERSEAANLRAENQMLRIENQTLTSENSRLKEEIKRVSPIVSRATGRSVEELEAMDKPWALEAAMHAVEEVIQMAPMDANLCSTMPTKDLFRLTDRSSPFAMDLKHKDKFHTEVTSVKMAGVELVEAFMDVNKWMEMFPCIVTTAKILQIISPGLSPPDRGGLLQLMHAELQLPSPLGATREIIFFRYCHQLSEGVWAVVDFSQHNSTLHSKRPSGRIIQQLQNGQSKLTWVEHSESQGGGVDMAFSAQRWLAALERQCQRLFMFNFSELEDEGRNIMKIAQRMIGCFYQDISASKFRSTASQFYDSVIITTRMSNIHNGLIICAATSLWLPVSPQILFDFLRDKRMRSKWEVSLEGKSIQEIKHIATGPHFRNCISLYHVTASNTEAFILQESCTDEFGSLIVYSPLDVGAVTHAMRGEDPSSMVLLPSAFTIFPEDSAANITSNNSSVLDSSGSEVSGSSLTATFQLVSTNWLAESPKEISNFVCNTLQRIKAAFFNEYM